MGNFSVVHELQGLFERPFDEHPEYVERYYRGEGDRTATQGANGAPPPGGPLQCPPRLESPLRPSQPSNLTLPGLSPGHSDPQP